MVANEECHEDGGEAAQDKEDGDGVAAAQGHMGELECSVRPLGGHSELDHLHHPFSHLYLCPTLCPT